MVNGLESRTAGTGIHEASDGEPFRSFNDDKQPAVAHVL